MSMKRLLLWIRPRSRLRSIWPSPRILTGGWPWRLAIWLIVRIPLVDGTMALFSRSLTMETTKSQSRSLSRYTTRTVTRAIKKENFTGSPTNNRSSTSQSPKSCHSVQHASTETFRQLNLHSRPMTLTIWFLNKSEAKRFTPYQGSEHCHNFTSKSWTFSAGWVGLTYR